MELESMKIMSRMVQDFGEVREAFIADPSTFLEKYAEIDVSALGISRGDLPGRDIVREHFERERGRVAIAVCAVVV